MTLIFFAEPIKKPTKKTKKTIVDKLVTGVEIGRCPL